MGVSEEFRVKKLNDFIYFNISGTSMFFLLKEHDKIKVMPVEIEDIEIGDIIVYRKNEEIIAHRVIRIQNSKERILFYTKGDNKMERDAPVWKSQVIGKVVAIKKPYGIVSIEGKIWKIINRVIAFYSSNLLIQKRRKQAFLILRLILNLSQWIARIKIFITRRNNDD